MGLTLKSDDKGVKVYRHDRTSSNGNPYTQYSIMVSSKNGDDWVNGFLDVAFSKGTDIANKTVIKIDEAFPMVSEYKEKVYIKWFIKSYTVLQTDNAQPSNVSEFVNVTADIEEELPFARPNR